MGKRTLVWLASLGIAFVALLAVENIIAKRAQRPRDDIKEVSAGDFLAAVQSGKLGNGRVGFHSTSSGLADVSAVETGAPKAVLWRTTLRLSEHDLQLLRESHFKEGDRAVAAEAASPLGFYDYALLVTRYLRQAAGWLLIVIGVVIAVRFLAVQTGILLPKKFEAVHSDVRFSSVAGCDEAKEEVSEIVEFLRQPERYNAAGGRMPRGVLLVGPPGTGKTMLAKAVAGEAKAKFYSLSGSDFVEMYVGVGASRIRTLFKKARESSPSIIFIDELDAVGRQRSSTSSSGGQQEHEHTLNALLVEMDGFASDAAVVVFAATNRPEIIDKALLRPGRFDRQVTVDLPDHNGREQILGVHAAGVKLSEGVSLANLARATPGFSGADLANLVNEGALHAARRSHPAITMEDFEEARDKISWGRERRRSLTPEDKHLIAVHEAGHALMQVLSGDTSVRLHKVTILPRGQSLGSTQFTPERDIWNYSQEQIENRIGCLMGGRVAEELVLGSITNGASADIQEASRLARRMVMQWGMSSRGFLALLDNDGQPLGSAQSLHEAEGEVKRILDELYQRTTQTLNAQRKSLDGIVALLLERETISGDTVRAIHRCAAQAA